MKWSIPAKTFLLGEYAAIAGASAIVLTTSPYFKLELTNQEELTGIHPNSPAGLWWQKQKFLGKGLSWQDPYQGCGGLGASSAQFLASYLASCHLQDKEPDRYSMLDAYYQSSWSGEGLKPSAYDLIAQSQHACVFINKQTDTIQAYRWPFEDLSFFLLHTGFKLATHHHLQLTPMPPRTEHLSAIVDKARQAFETKNSKQLIQSVKDYHYQLATLNLVAPHSLEQINLLKEHPEIIAIKGCGALGSDVLLLICKRTKASSLKVKLLRQNCRILATEASIAAHPSILN